jgi:phage-related minor tail protein
MWAGSICRSLLVAGLLGAATGCFVFDEIDKSSALIKGPAAGGDKAAAAPGAVKGGAAKSAAAKPGADATTAAKPAAPSEKGWWQTARTLGSEQSEEGITRCELAGRAEFMLRDDCLARGGVPK